MIFLNHLKNRDVYREFTFDEFIGFVNNPLDESYDKDTKPPPAISFSNFNLLKPIKDNVVSYSALVLDYDNKNSNCRFDDIVSMFIDKNINHVAYTTMSHTKIVNKFRVVLPMDNNITKTDWEYLSQNIPNLKKSVFLSIPLFKNIDETSFDTARFFYIPVMRNDYKFSIFKSGRNFNDSDWYETNKKLQAYRTQCNGFLKTQPKIEKNFDGVINYIIRESLKFNWSRIDSGLSQGTNSWMFKMTSFLNNAGVPESTALSLISKMTDNKKATSQWNHAVLSAYKSKNINVQPYRVIKTKQQIIKTSVSKFIKPEPDNFYQPDKIKDYITNHQRIKVITFRGDVKE